MSSAALAISTSVLIGADAPTGSLPAMPRRPYKPGIDVSIIGFPALMLMRYDQQHCNQLVARAVERGCSYFDVAPAYGNAQERLGPALQPFRKNVFLACKTKMRDAARCKKDLDRSLQLLKTDYLDLYQLHAIIDPRKDVDAAFASDGAMKTILEARKAGVIRHIGFTGHTIEAGLAALDRFEFDSVLFPINFASFYKGDFGPVLLEAARKKNCTRISMKSMVRQEWPPGAQRGKWKHMWYEPLSDPREADLAVRFALSQDITVAIPPGDENLFWIAMDIGSAFKPITAEEDRQLQAMAQSLNPLFRKGKITG